LLGFLVVVEKKKKKNKRKKESRKRKSIENGGANNDGDHIDDDNDYDDGDDDDSTSPLSYTYTNCDSITILQEQEQQFQQQQQQEPSLMYNAQTPTTTTNIDNTTIHSTYNDDDDDESTIGSEQSPPMFRWLNWRMDPIKSFSDWTIDVVIAPIQRKALTGTTTTRSSTATSSTKKSTDIPPHATSIQRYHVHRNVLVVESQLFQSLLYNQQEQCNTNTIHSTSIQSLFNTSTTIVSLNDIYEANVFPTFLDYMYSPGHVWITQQNAITMLLFAKQFGMKRLQWLTKQFLKRNHEINLQQQQQCSDGIRTKSNATSSSNVINMNKKSTFIDRMNNLSKVVVGTNIQSSPTMSMVHSTTTTTEPSICDILTDTISSPIDYTISFNNHINHNTQATINNNNNNNNNNMFSPIPVSTTTTSTMNMTNFQKRQQQQQQHHNNNDMSATNSSPTTYL
jgi:hypothetical protein